MKVICERSGKNKRQKNNLERAIHYTVRRMMKNSFGPEPVLFVQQVPCIRNLSRIIEGIDHI